MNSFNPKAWPAMTQLMNNVRLLDGELALRRIAEEGYPDMRYPSDFREAAQSEAAIILGLAELI